MKKVAWSVAAALALSMSAPAFAADMPVKAAPAPAVVAAPSPWDIAFGAAIMNDYVFRGITQSNHKGSVAAYFEPRYNLNKDFQLYAGISGESISFTNRAAADRRQVAAPVRQAVPPYTSAPWAAPPPPPRKSRAKPSSC